ncbi:NADP-reducing hydrogenase subunit HndA [Ruminiclostridium hungatei]|uniref:NADP-reducing hydrogenase subunit HndA n=1 Tax=Ruminiclostridium hungatei TaxID=48256 RepID=A0A1V4SJH6_RUMHU|nr:NAD(P)H-dependent oxidoreductase subunit E [Ruminiclostridium hungatei]OPX44038.1 NADP-reducing hydrogenase subunit HndA [Ruminiclostridium hungatei]
MQKVKEVLNRHGNSKDNLIQVMLELQNLSGTNSLPHEWVEFVAVELDMPLSRVYSVITFYSMFGTEPRGKYVVEVCKSAPCHVTGAGSLLAMLEKELQVKPGQTTEDGVFTLIQSACFGACDISPAIKIGDKVYGNLTPEKLSHIVNTYREVQ